MLGIEIVESSGGNVITIVETLKDIVVELTTADVESVTVLDIVTPVDKGTLVESDTPVDGEISLPVDDRPPSEEVPVGYGGPYDDGGGGAYCRGLTCFGKRTGDDRLAAGKASLRATT